MLGFVLVFLAIVLFADIIRRANNLIDDVRADEETEINRSASISRRAYDEIN